MPSSEFLHCTTCFDFDLCRRCFVSDNHGHSPGHGFISAVADTVLPANVTNRLAPGRNQKHNAICDGCDKFIVGVRHKCLDCPDWDYCGSCVSTAGFVHPGHRFVPVYEPINEMTRAAHQPDRVVHYGIWCDGPLCTSSSGNSPFITGDRYKCVVCNNTDFCANCEASPALTHNKTHPLIKFKTPIRGISVTTTGQYKGEALPVLGDRFPAAPSNSQSRSTETTSAPQQLAINNVLTVMDVKPTEVSEAPAATVDDKVDEMQEKTEETEENVNEATEIEQESETKQEDVEPKDVEVKHENDEPEKTIVAKTSPSEDLVAVFERDIIPDGSALPPNHVFEQTWFLRNAGTVSWPAGCRVKFVSGDYMGHVDPRHPAGIHELVSASETTICYEALAPGEEVAFTVLLRTPARLGKAISYWRLCTEDGFKFGHRLWCDIDVQEPQPAEGEKKLTTLLFPKLDKEAVGMDGDLTKAESIKAEQGSAKADDDEIEEYEVCDDEWAEDASQDGFMTDEEYDILDASDEEYLEDQQKKLLSK